MKEGWEYKKLGEVCDFQGGSQPPKNEWSKEPKSDYVRMLQIRDFTQDASNYIEYVKKTKSLKYCNEDDILLGRYGASVGKILSGLSGAYNVAIIKSIPKEIVIKRYIRFYFLSSYFQHNLFIASQHRAAQAGFSKEDIVDFRIPIPSLSEQQRIVEELDLLSSIIEKKKEQLKELDNLAQSIFYDMFGDPVTNERGWEIKYLEEIADSKIGLTYKPTDVEEHGTIVLRSSNIQDSTIDLSDIVRVSCNISKTKYVKEGDILMCSRNGSFRLVGKVARIKGLPEEMTYGAFMTIIRSCYNDYLFHFFKSPAFRVQLGTAKTATINQITVKMLNSIKVGIPPLELQQQFASKIEAIEKQKELIKQSIKEVETLFNSRMDYYFN